MSRYEFEGGPEVDEYGTASLNLIGGVDGDATDSAFDYGVDDENLFDNNEDEELDFGTQEGYDYDPNKFTTLFTSRSGSLFSFDDDNKDEE